MSATYTHAIVAFNAYKVTLKSKMWSSCLKHPRVLSPFHSLRQQPPLTSTQGGGKWFYSLWEPWSFLLQVENQSQYVIIFSLATVLWMRNVLWATMEKPRAWWHTWAGSRSQSRSGNEKDKWFDFQGHASRAVFSFTTVTMLTMFNSAK